MYQESKPGLIKVNLQHFAEESVETVDTSVENAEDTPTEPFGGEELAEQEQTQEFDTKPFLDYLNDGKLMYNKEAVTVESIEDLINGYQKSLNYDKVFETKSNLEQQLQEAQNNPQLKFFGEMAKRYGFDDPSKYIEAVEAQWKQDQINELVQKNIPEEYAKELLENKEFREKYEADQQAKEAKDKEAAMYQSFVETFPGVDASNIPQEVWNAVQDGQDLTAAYAIYQVKHMDTIKTEAQQEAIKAMTENAQSSSGSVTEQSTSETGVMSIDQINATLANMTSSEQSKWIDSNYDMIEKSGYFKKF